MGEPNVPRAYLLFNEVTRASDETTATQLGLPSLAQACPRRDFLVPFAWFLPGFTLTQDVFQEIFCLG